MRLLFDTNVLIHIEDPKALAPELQELLALIRKHGHAILVHPSSFDDISRDGDEARKKVTRSKFAGYPVVERHTPIPDFLAAINSADEPASTPNEQADNEILYALYKNNVDFLVTEDQGILKKAARIGFDERVFTITAALRYIKSLHERWRPEHRVLKNEKVTHLNLQDPFFDSLREDYGETAFGKWFEKACREDRECWHYEEGGKHKAVMILKEEDEVVETAPPLPKKRRLKISTLKVDMPGSKIGELFLKIAFEYCMKNGIQEVYLTHYVIENDPLIALLDEYEFTRYAHARNRNQKGEPEQVFLKSFAPTAEDLKGMHALRFAKKYYPLFRDGSGIRKFLVPIKPEYHNRLFPNYAREQVVLSDYQLTPYGNAIKKAYLCRSSITRIAPGDILIFYRSHDEQAVGCVGVVEKVMRSKNTDEIVRFVGKRTVYSVPEIAGMASDAAPILAMLFRHHINLQCRLNLEQLGELGILKSAPQSIKEINNKQYAELKAGCKLDEHIAIS